MSRPTIDPDRLFNKLVEMGFQYSSQQANVSIWRRPESDNYDRVNVPLGEFLTASMVRHALRTAGCTPDEITDFIRDVSC